ncbi:MAG: SRPBCC domain-containing protein [Bacteroidetes bacterium]|nr:SRPBCC domain-containing protein [Bacteroidota bacterium]
MNELNIKKTITLNAEASKVWEALTKPEMIKKYMSGTEVISEWKVGSPILWVGTTEGEERVKVKGSIEKMEVGKLIQYSALDLDTESIDIPTNYVKATFELIPKLGKTLLSVTEGDYSRVEDGRKRFVEADGGWNRKLDALKAFIENKR